MGSHVHVKEAVLVTPCDPTPSKTLTLSALDSQLFLRFTIEYLLVYKPGPRPDAGSVAARLKAALAKALVPYFPLAGRVRAKPDGSSRLEVLCRGQGAVFIEAMADHIAAGEFERAPKNVTEWRKLLPFHAVEAPPLVVQLTWLKGGAAALGVGIKHCLCDGIGSTEFLNLLAELAKLGVKSRSKPKPAHVWDRHLMDPRPPGYPCLSSHVRNNSVTLTQTHHPEFTRVPDLCGFTSRFANETLIPTSITFNKASLDELKRLASSSTSRLNESSALFTSFEVLAAHVWRSWARSLSLPPTQILKLLFSVNVRTRVKPIVPSGYYGNAFVLACAQTSAKELTEKGLVFAATLVKRAKDRVDDEYVRRVVEIVSESGSEPGPSRWACPDSSVGVLILSQWSRMGLERVDFGIGRPVNVGPVCCDRYCLLLPVHDQREAVKVMVAVPASGARLYECLARAPCT